MSPLNKFFKHFGHFLTGNILLLMLGFISFPILTRVLTKEQYGIITLVTSTMLFSVTIAKAGLSDGIIRFYREYSRIPELLTQFISTILIRGGISSVFIVLLYLILFQVCNINRYLKINDKYVICFIIMAAYLFIRPLNIIVLNFLRVNGKTIFMNVVNLVEKILSIGLSLFLLIYIVHELYGYFIGVVFAEFMISLILFHWFFTHYKITMTKASRNITSKLIKFGSPLLFTELSFLLMSYADRYLILAYHGEAVLGLYSVGYSLASYLSNMIMFSLSYAVVPIYVEIYEKEGKEKTEDFLQRCIYYLLIAIIPICIGYFAISKSLFITLASKKYIDAATFSPIILIGWLFLAMNSIFNAGLYLKKKTMTILIIAAISATINIIMNVILLPKHGAMGAAIATLISCLAATVLTVILSYKYIIVKIDLKTVVFYFLLSCVMFSIIKQIEIQTNWLNLVTKIVIYFFIILLGVMFREKAIIEKTKEIYNLRKKMTSS